MKEKEILKLLQKDGWNMRFDSREKALIENIAEITERNLKANPVENRVMPKIAEVVTTMKKRIWSSLSEYLSGENIPPERIQILNLMAENECRICDELLTEIKSNFTA